MNICDIIRKKRDGGELTAEEIGFFIGGCTDGSIPDYQLSALLMAICLRSMTAGETALLTDAMARSGEMTDLSAFGDLSVDKHSTGGVGDKTTLVVAPIVASLGGKVAKMSGRGLGHTGGTVDKLESIPGFRTSMSAERFIEQVENTGIAVIGQAKELAPADKKLYALRDVTATVDSLPLIVSSIMSKKLAAGARSIVLDVKTGSGAFMKTLPQARELAEAMVEIGKHCGRRVSAVLTDMDTPLGHNIGNSLEVAEAVEVLSGKGNEDLTRVCVVLSGRMLELCRGWSREEAEKKVYGAIRDGSALEKMKEWITAQGGDAEYICTPSKFPPAAFAREIRAGGEGYISHIDTRAVGQAAVLLGAGRMKKDEPIDHSAGITLLKKTGAEASYGETLAIIYSREAARLDAAYTELMSAYGYSEKRPDKHQLIYGII